MGDLWWFSVIVTGFSPFWVGSGGCEGFCMTVGGCGWFGVLLAPGFDSLWAILCGCSWFLADRGWFCVVACFVTKDK